MVVIDLESEEVLANDPLSNYNVNSQHHTSLDFYRMSPFAGLKMLLGNRMCQKSSSGSGIPSFFICVIGNTLNKFNSNNFLFIF